MKKSPIFCIGCSILLVSSCANVTPINDGSEYNTYMITVGGYNSINDIIKEANKLCGEKGFTPLASGTQGPSAIYTMYGPVLSTQKSMIIRCNEKKNK